MTPVAMVNDGNVLIVMVLMLMVQVTPKHFRRFVLACPRVCGHVRPLSAYKFEEDAAATLWPEQPLWPPPSLSTNTGTSGIATATITAGPAAATVFAAASAAPNISAGSSAICTAAPLGGSGEAEEAKREGEWEKERVEDKKDERGKKRMPRKRHDSVGRKIQ